MEISEKRRTISKCNVLFISYDLGSDGTHQRTSATAVRDDLRCQAFHDMNQPGPERCYHCAGRGASTSPESQLHSTLERETPTSFPITPDTSHPTIYLNVQLGTDHPPAGRYLPPISAYWSPTARMDCATAPSHELGTPSALLPADTSLVAP